MLPFDVTLSCLADVRKQYNSEKRFLKKYIQGTTFNFFLALKSHNFTNRTSTSYKFNKLPPQKI